MYFSIEKELMKIIEEEEMDEEVKTNKNIYKLTIIS